MSSTRITGIVLAGGQSRRIGANKSLLKIGESFIIDHVLRALSPLSSSVIIVTDEAHFILLRSSNPDARVVQDIYPARGPLGGIYTGLLHSEDVYNLVVGCDMPFLNADFINYLIDEAPGHDIVVPRIEWKTEPLHALYSRSCLPAIESLLQDGQLQIIKLFDRVNTHYITEKEIDRFDPDHLTFFNINTENDLARAQALKETVKGR